METNNNIVIDTANRTVTQKPRRTGSTRSSNKSETQGKELDYIKDTCSLLKEMRLKQEYTQPDLALKSGIKQQVISRIECNDLNPRVSTLKRYLQAFGVDLDELLREILINMDNE